MDVDISPVIVDWVKRLGWSLNEALSEIFLIPTYFWWRVSREVQYRLKNQKLKKRNVNSWTWLYHAKFIITFINSRRLIASRDVKPGEVVVLESSLMLVPGIQVSSRSSSRSSSPTSQAGSDLFACVECQAPLEREEMEACNTCGFPLCSHHGRHTPAHQVHGHWTCYAISTLPASIRTCRWYEAEQERRWQSPFRWSVPCCSTPGCSWRPGTGRRTWRSSTLLLQPSGKTEWKLRPEIFYNTKSKVSSCLWGRGRSSRACAKSDWQREAGDWTGGRGGQ